MHKQSRASFIVGSYARRGRLISREAAGGRCSILPRRLLQSWRQALCCGRSYARRDGRSLSWAGPQRRAWKPRGVDAASPPVFFGRSTKRRLDLVRLRLPRIVGHARPDDDAPAGVEARVVVAEARHEAGELVPVAAVVGVHLLPRSRYVRLSPEALSRTPKSATSGSSRPRERPPTKTWKPPCQPSMIGRLSPPQPPRMPPSPSRSGTREARSIPRDRALFSHK